jgi:VWFA-related protein
VLFWVFAALGQATAQPGSSVIYGTQPGAVPLVNVGGGPSDSQFFAMDFAQKVLEEQNRAKQKERERQQKLVATGMVSALDLAAPTKAVNEFNLGTAELRGQHSQDAIAHLQKAVTAYPKFVSAHNYLGMAYQDADDPANAQKEFEAAVALDDKFVQSYVNLGRLALSRNNYSGAMEYLSKAVALQPVDANVLTTLAYAQQGNREYETAIQTVEKVHSVDHVGYGNAHYIAATSAVSLGDYTRAETEFGIFLQEDPNNALAATARYNLDVLAKNKQAIAAAQAANAANAARAAAQPKVDLANADRLKAELAGAADEAKNENCAGCNGPTLLASASATPSLPTVDRVAGSGSQFTIRKVVDEVAVFFGVSSGGHSVNGLGLDNITVRDDSKPPEKILQFSPQSKLPLRIGLIMDTSGSVQPRFSFEKRVATKFLEQMLTNPADLGFVAGFSDSLNVTQDFTGNQQQLAAGVEVLKNEGGTALFDAVSKASMKLSAYPEHERVARVLVVLSDGEENSSHSSLRQTIRDLEATGVTVYTISTKDGRGVTTEADKVMQMLAERSGGQAFFPGDLPTLSSTFDKLRDEIRSRYLIAYRPADFQANGQYRTIVITAHRDGKAYKVYSRKGYHARVESSPQ